MKIPLSRHFLLQSPSFFYWIHGWKVNPLSREIDLDMDLDLIREVRNTWQFFRDRRPETYGAITEL